jgi:hygromycin-B 7''-O-kinase
MGEARVYSERLGAISDAQFEAVAERFGLGRFVSATPIASGLFGQNVFVATTGGEFVLRGAPHWVKGRGETEWRREDRWQFTKERFFARHLHERTKTPVPWPMLHDEASDIFGWPYLVMPRMPGLCTDERAILKILTPDDRREVAAALAENLLEMQKLTWDFAGDFDRTSIALEPFQGGAMQRVVDETLEMAAATAGTLTDDDRAWIAHAATRALATSDPAVNAYVHVDYKLNNLTLSKDRGRWRVSGLFDLHEGQFSDGARDIVREACIYLDTEPASAQIFVETYAAGAGRGEFSPDRMALYVINDRLKFWEFFARPDNRPDWLEGKTFRGWTERYVRGVLDLL